MMKLILALLCALSPAFAIAASSTENQSSAPAPGQEKTITAIGPWNLGCGGPSGCVLTQMRTNGTEPPRSVILGATYKFDGIFFYVQTPLLERKNVLFEVDGEGLGVLTLDSCHEDRCGKLFTFKDEQFQKVREGKTLTIRMITVEFGEAMAELSLDQFSEALDQLKAKSDQK